jgi:ABC-type Fe3+ transport system substrate-binding protein
LCINSKQASLKILPICGSPIATAELFLLASSSKPEEAKAALDALRKKQIRKIRLPMTSKLKKYASGAKICDF